MIPCEACLAANLLAEALEALLEYNNYYRRTAAMEVLRRYRGVAHSTECPNIVAPRELK